MLEFELTHSSIPEEVRQDHVRYWNKFNGDFHTKGVGVSGHFFTGTAHAQALGFWISLVYLSSLHKIPRSLSIPQLDFALWTVLVKSSIEQNLAGDRQ